MSRLGRGVSPTRLHNGSRDGGRFRQGTGPQRAEPLKAARSKPLLRAWGKYPSGGPQGNWTAIDGSKPLLRAWGNIPRAVHRGTDSRWSAANPSFAPWGKPSGGLQ